MRQTVAYLVMLSLAADASVVAKGDAPPDAVTYSEDALLVKEVKRAIGVYEGTSQRGDNLTEQRAVKDDPAERNASADLTVRYPGGRRELAVANNSADIEHKINTTKTDENSTQLIADAGKQVLQDTAINDNFKIYFGSDKDEQPVRLSKPAPEDDGKIYFEPMLPRKNSTRPWEATTESNIMRIDAKKDKANGTATTTPASENAVTLDNRNAFNADMPCGSGMSRVMGKCVQKE